MLLSAALLCLAAAPFVALAIYRDPKLLIPLVVIGLPIEYFGTESLDTLGESGIGGAIRALLNPGKAAMLATVVVGVMRLRWEPRRLIPDSSLLLPVFGFLALMFLGVLWSDTLKAPNQVLILPLYVAFLVVAPSMIEDRRDLERIFGAFLLVTIGLSLLALAQRVSGVFNWRYILIQADEVTYRSNATFADPNHLARYLAVSITLAVGLILLTGPRRMTLYLAIPAVVLGLAASVATASRSGWLMVLFCGFLMVLFSPISRYTRARILGAGAVFVLALVVITLAQGGNEAERIRSLTDSTLVLGLREFLIKAGWAMWEDNPLVGVGSGNFQRALTTSYIDILPVWARTTLSHTSLISLLAELGIVGIAMFALVTIKTAIVVVRTRLRAADPYVKMTITWLGIALLGILLQSQSEGRLIDEPYIWLLLAMVVACETQRRFGAVAARAAQPEAARAEVRSSQPAVPARGAGLPAGSPAAAVTGAGEH